MVPVIGAAAIVILTACGAPHDAEIETIAGTMAIAFAVSEECPGITPGDAFLEVLRGRLHIVKAYHLVSAPRAYEVSEALQRGLAEAPSWQAWCSAVCRLHRPEEH